MGRRVLEFLGLDKTAAAVYQALLAAGGGPVDISVVTGLSEAAIDVALGELAGLNLVRPPVGISGDWRAVRPEFAFTALVRQHEADLADLRAAVATADATWSARHPYPGSPAEPVMDWSDAVAEVGRLAAQAAKEFLLVMPAEPGPLALLHIDLTRYEAAVARGVRILALYHDSTRSDPAALVHARRATLVGAEVRTAPVLPLPMVVCDGQVALIQTGAGRPEAALYVREQSIAAMLDGVFDNAWEVATPLATPITPDQATGLTPEERALLQLLAGGAKNATAAGRLGVSESTVARQMRDLMIRLGATSRFQAGVNAAKRGWL
jgi:DNA-binding NarL/FixJ family response regulator